MVNELSSFKEKEDNNVKENEKELQVLLTKEKEPFYGNQVCKMK